MSTSDQPIVYTYTADGSTDTFPFLCKVLDTTHLKVYLDEVLQTTGYTISGIGNDSGGNVVFSSNPAADTIVLLHRELPLNRDTDYQDSEGFLESVVDRDQDIQTQQLQQINEQFSRTLFLKVGTDIDTEIPIVAGEYLKFNADGDGFETASGEPVDDSIIHNDILIYTGVGDYYEGTISTGVLTLTIQGSLDTTPLSGGAYRDGLKVRFRTSSTNAGALDVRLYDGTTYGPTVDVKDQAGSELSASDFNNNYYEIEYDSASGDFIYQKPAAASVPDESITIAKLADGTAYHVIGFDSGGEATTFYPKEFYQSTHTVVGTETFFEFTSIPSSATRIDISCRNLSSNSTSGFAIQLGHSGTTYITSNYYGQVEFPGIIDLQWSTMANIAYTPLSTTFNTAMITLLKSDNNVWVINSTLAATVASGNAVGFGIGYVDVTAALTAIKFLLNGAGAYDSGTVTINVYANKQS